MIIEVHAVQNIAPANLNRDDTGAPKDAVFGGYRRARVSSQSWKRAVRQSFRPEFTDSELSVRTRLLADQITNRLAATRDRDEAAIVARELLKAAGADLDKNNRTKVLWFVPARTLDLLAARADEHWDALLALSQQKAAKEKAAKKATAEDKAAEQLAKTIRDQVREQVVNARAVDLALFGRMLTDAPDGGTVDAAVQVAHALSTHSVDVEFDYFTAVDDLLPGEETGAGMIGTIEFNSACYYRYAALNTRQLADNLDRDWPLTKRATAAFLASFVTAIPTGKQNTFAAHNPPGAVVFIARPSGTWNLANAFIDPIRATSSADLVTRSCRALATHWAELLAMYGDPCAPDGRIVVSCLPHLTPALGEFLGESKPMPLADAVTNMADVLE